MHFEYTQFTRLFNFQKLRLGTCMIISIFFFLSVYKSIKVLIEIKLNISEQAINVIFKTNNKQKIYKHDLEIHCK